MKDPLFDSTVTFNSSLFILPLQILRSIDSGSVKGFPKTVDAAEALVYIQSLVSFPSLCFSFSFPAFFFVSSRKTQFVWVSMLGPRPKLHI